ncbi:MAG: N-acetylmuramoyl-L-alanine amidase [Acidobacteriota bacterium]
MKLNGKEKARFIYVQLTFLITFLLIGNSLHPIQKNNISRIVIKRVEPVGSIVIDPGHGGSDYGSIGSSGIKEKDINLSIARKLKFIIEERMGIKISLTRDEDTEMTIDERVSFANNLRASLFISIHTNFSFLKNENGPYCYYFNPSSTYEDSRYLAGSDKILEKGKAFGNEDISFIPWNVAQIMHLGRSKYLSELVQKELNFLFEIPERNPKAAPFKILNGTNMPAMVIEMIYLSNQEDEKKIMDLNFHYSISSSIYKGISQFLKENF